MTLVYQFDERHITRYAMMMFSYLCQNNPSRKERHHDLSELRFVLADLAAVLDITNVTQLRSRLSDDLCQTYPVPDRRGQVQQTWTVNEPGLYEVIIRSDKPEATQFRRWLLDNNFAFRGAQGKIIPMQDAVNRGILTLTERIDKAGKIRPQLLVTPAGQTYFANILSA